MNSNEAETESGKAEVATQKTSDEASVAVPETRENPKNTWADDSDEDAEKKSKGGKVVKNKEENDDGDTSKVVESKEENGDGGIKKSPVKKEASDVLTKRLQKLALEHQKVIVGENTPVPCASCSRKI
jgi:hypothetical protein